MLDDLKYWVWLSSLVKISPAKRIALLKHFGGPLQIWDAAETELSSLKFLKRQNIMQLCDKQARKDSEGWLDRIMSSRMDVITFDDNRYPQCLKNIYDPPAVLYAKGELRPDDACLAVIGSRRATSYGLETAEKLSAVLAKSGLTIVSGMARGIDSRAHRGALGAGGRTVAVLGCGVDIIYPEENTELMERICKNGAVISEYLPGVPPVPFNFPARNRIISGISLGVAVIEASDKSGSLITADFALEQGREVFAVPGNINSRNSTGTNKLIRDGAKMVTEAYDILEELNMGHPNPGRTAGLFSCGRNFTPPAGLDNEELTVARRLSDEPLHIDALARECGFTVQLTGSILVMLELNGFVQQLPGRYYRLACC